MEANIKKLELIERIINTRDAALIDQMHKMAIEFDENDRYYTRERFYEDGTPKDKIEEKPKKVNEARRKIKGIFNFYK